MSRVVTNVNFNRRRANERMADVAVTADAATAVSSIAAVIASIIRCTERRPIELMRIQILAHTEQAKPEPTID